MKDKKQRAKAVERTTPSMVFAFVFLLLSCAFI
jgi:hypothetical protein